jgi:predicted RND superfamily exporter protein
MLGFTVRRPFAVLALVAAVTAGLAAQIPHLELDPDTEAFIPKGHPIRVYWNAAKERFDVGKDIFVGIVADGPDGIFTPEILAGVAAMTEGLERLATVMPGDVKSLSATDAILGSEEGLDIEPFFETAPRTREEAAAVREKVFENDVYLDRLVSRDGSIAAIIVQAHDAYDASSPYPHPVEVFHEVRDYVEAHPIPGTHSVVGGNTSIEAAFGRQMTADLANLIPTALMVVVVTLFLCFRRGPLWPVAARAALLLVLLSFAAQWNGTAASPQHLAMAAAVLAMLTVRGVLLPALVVTLALVWTWGIQAMMRMPIYISGTLIPPIILAVGCADGIHILERYFDEARKTPDKNAAIVATMSALWRPVVFTSLTTAIGFGSLMFGSMTVYQVFGFTAAVGILAAMLLSTTLLPASLALLPLPPAGQHTQGRALAVNGLGLVGEAVVRHRRVTLTAFGMLTLVLLVGVTRTRVDYSWAEMLEPDSPTLAADRILRTRHGGSMPMNLVVTAAEPDGIKDPALLRAIDRVLAELGEHPAVGDTRSIAEYIKRMNEALNENRPEERRIPDDRQLIAQYLLLYAMSGDPTELDDMVDYDYQRAHAGVLLRSDWLSDMSDVIARAEQLLDEHVRPLGAEAVVTGSAMIQSTVFDLIISSQVSSIAMATIVVALFMLVLFRSVTVALLCMVPPAFAILANFGIMGLLNMPLGPTESMVGAIALGIGIDYSIHLVSRLREMQEEGGTVDSDIVTVMHTTGRAILFNAAVVVAGFTVLALSKTPSNAAFGWQLATNMVLCSIAALVLLPALLYTVAGERSPNAATQGSALPGPRSE